MATNILKRSLKVKIILAFLAVIPIILCIGAVSWYGLRSVMKASASDAILMSVIRQVLISNSFAKDFRISGDQKYVQEFQKLVSSATKDLESFKERCPSPSLKKEAEGIAPGIKRLQGHFEDMVRNRQEMSKLTEELNGAVHDFSAFADSTFRKPLSERQNMAVITGEQLGASVPEFLAILNRAIEVFYEFHSTYLSSVLFGAKDQKLLDQVSGKMQGLFQDLLRVGKILEAEEKRNDVVVAVGELLKRFERYSTSAKELMGLHDKDASLLKQLRDAESQVVLGLNRILEESAKSMEATERRSQLTFSILIVATILVQLLISWLVGRSIARPLEIISMRLSDAAEQVASAAEQVSSSSTSMAEAASEQAAGLEETSSSLEEISSRTNTNATNADQASKGMEQVRQIVERVNRHMKDMMNAMEEITLQTSETGKIIKTIDEIAFQTNLLALNAAVEAARAGEAGAGFAVVADEVRSLALRAAEAAKNTSKLIEATIESVKAGKSLAEATAQAFAENVDIAAKVGTLVAEVSAASMEQAQGVQQISKAVVEMDKIVQQVAAGAEQAASASQEMKSQAEEMKNIVTDMISLIKGSADTAHWEDGPRERPLLTHQKALVTRELNPKTPASGKEVSPQELIPLDEEELKKF